MGSELWAVCVPGWTGGGMLGFCSVCTPEAQQLLATMDDSEAPIPLEGREGPPYSGF